MAALSIVAASVVPATGYEDVGEYIAGEAVTPFMPVYQSTETTAFANGVVYKCDSNVASNAKGAILGVTMATAAIGQPVPIGKGKITVGSIAAAGLLYHVANTASGEVIPSADLASGDYVVQVGIGISSTVIDVQPKNWGIQK